MSTVAQIKLEILRMPTDLVDAAYSRNASAPVASFSKAQKAEVLAQWVYAGTINMQDIRSAFVPVPHPIQPAPVVGSADLTALKEQSARHAGLISELDGHIVGLKQSGKLLGAQLTQIQTGNQETLRRIDASAQVANRAEQLALGLNNSLATINEDLASLGNRLEKVNAIKQEIIDPKEIDAKVAQVIAEAFKPFRKVVEDAGAQSVVADAVSNTVTDRKKAKDVFGVSVTDVKGNPVLVDVWDSKNAPAADPCFIWQADIVKVLLLAQDTGANVWFGGEKGSGKSETVRNFCASTGRPFTRINFHKHSTVDDFIGSNGLDSNGTLFKPGDFLKAFTTPGAVILLDELCNAPSDVLSIFNPFLESNCAVNYGGSVWRRAPGVLIIAADNSFGSGDDTGRHAGLKTINSATIDRFSLIVPFTFLPKSVEVKALVKHTGCSAELAAHVVDAIDACRKKVKSGDIIDAPSIRSAIAFIRACARIDVADAWSMTVTQRQPAESAAALEAIFKATINPDFIKANI